MKFQPKVSIIIPVYNGSNFLKEAIESSINQTYKNIEIIVVNDGSNDDNKTENIALSYSKHIKYLKKENGGVASALNLGIRNMTGDYFSWLSHDDLYSPDKIKNQINKLEQLEDRTTLICCRHCVVTEKLKYLYEKSFDEEAEQLVYPALKMLFKGYIHGCGLLIHKSHFERVGLFNEALPTTQDYDLWFRMLRKQKIYLNDQVDVISRSHEEQGSKKYLKEHIRECDSLWINIVNTLTDEEKVEISGSLYDFYKELYEFLDMYTQYEECIAYIKRLYAKEIRKSIIKNNEKVKYIFPSIMSDNIRELFSSKSGKHKILFGDYGDWGDKGGLNRAVANMASQLSKYYDVYIISNGQRSLGYSLSQEVKYIDMDIMKIHKGDLREFSLLLLALEIDIHIGVHNCSNYILNVYEQCRKDKIKNIAWNHEFYFIPYWNTELSNILKGRIETFKKLEACFWLTSFNERIYSNLAENGVVMENALSWTKPLDINYNREEPNIISIARFNDSRKCLDKLLKVFSIVLKKRSNAKLYVVGQYDLDMKCSDRDITIGQLIKELEIPSKNIVFTGFLDDMTELLKEMSINIVTAYHEGFGLIINEAGMYKVPTIAYNDSGFEDLITNNYNGFLVPRNEEYEMANKIIELLDDKELCKKMGQNAYVKCDEYLPEKITSKWIKVLDRILESNNQEQLNKFYKESYMIDKTYDDTFVKNIINQYEIGIQRIILNNELALANKNICDSNIEIYRLNNQIENIMESTSWKITKPARIISAYFKTWIRMLLRKIKGVIKR